MVVLGLAIQEGKPAEKMAAFRKKHKITYRLLSDEPGKVIEKFGFTGIPQNVVIDRSGTYVAAPNTLDELEKAIVKALK